MGEDDSKDVGDSVTRDGTTKQQNCDSGATDQENKPEESKYDMDRLHITNIPRLIGYKQFKKFLEKNIPGYGMKKIRQMGDYAYVSFETADGAQKAIEVLHGIELKKCKLSAKLAMSEERKVKPFATLVQEHTENPSETKPKTARESVTPLADVPYEEQLAQKNKECFKTTERLTTQMRRAGINSSMKASQILKEIKPSPKTKEYRNKCEFTVGVTLTGELCVGFVGGRFAKNQHYVIPADDVDNITSHTKSIVADFSQFVRDSGLPPFDEFNRTGTWKMLTVREFGGDVMVIVTVFPLESKDKEHELKDQLCKRFLDMSTLTTKGFRVTSLYWQNQEHCSDTIEYQHIGGTPYIYETVLDCRFRVSPSAFFQTNSQAASVLYTTIGEACGLSSSENPSNTHSTESARAVNPSTVESMETGANDGAADGESASKKIKLEEAVTDGGSEASVAAAAAAPVDEGTILLDICCGTGTIGQCLLKQYKKHNKMCSVGIEMVASAVEDAKQNAKNNGLDEKTCKYIAGKAEDVFRSLKYYLSAGFSLDRSVVVGVLDPPRAGLHEKVILGCRQMETLRRLVFVSCDPSAAMKNLIDLCRPTSKKYDGEPFRIECIQPVDMFPQTSHFEWVVTLQR